MTGLSMKAAPKESMPQKSTQVSPWVKVSAF